MIFHMNARTSTALLLPCLATALLLGGCAHTARSRLYEGAARDPAKVAVLWCPMLLDPLEMDGKDLANVAGFLPIETHYCFELLPGRHEFTVRYSGISGNPAGQQQMLYSKPVRIIFEAQPGRQYQATYKQPQDDIRFVKTITNLSVSINDITDNQQALAKWGLKPAPASAKIITPAKADTPQPPDILEQLRLSWNRISEKQRADFMRWMVTRPSLDLESNPLRLDELDQMKHWWIRASANEQGDFLAWSVSAQ